MKNIGSVLSLRLLAIAITAALPEVEVRAESAAGIVRADVGAEGYALLGLPFHPFGEGRLDDVLHGRFLGGGDWLEADSASLWLADSQSWSNAWFGLDGAWQGLEDFEFAAGDAFRFNNRRDAPLSVFLKGAVPYDDDINTVLFPGLNLVSSPYPTTVEDGDTGQVYPIGSGFWILSDGSGVASMSWQSPYAATGAGDDGGTPRIVGIDIDESVPAAVVQIDGGGKTVDIISLNVDRSGAFAFEGWNHEARVDMSGSGEFLWNDPGFAAFLADPENAARFYLVGDASVDSVGDGISDVFEYETLPPFLFLERFEVNTVTNGPVAGQNGWVAGFSAEVGEVQTNSLFAGKAALRVGSLDTEAPVAMVSRVFTNAPQVVWIDMRQVLGHTEETPPEPQDTAAAYYFDTKMRPVVLDGGMPEGSRWVTLTDAQRPARDEWARVTMKLDYVARTWDFYVDGIVVAKGLGFATDENSLRALEFEGHLGYYDDVFVSEARPYGISDQVGGTVAGSAIVASSGAWLVSGDSIRALERAGSLTYALDVPSPAPHAIAFTIGQSNPLSGSSDFDLALWIDGIPLSRQVVNAPYGERTEAVFFLPELAAGGHLFKLVWHNQRENTFLEINGVRFLMYGDPGGADGFDWPAYLEPAGGASNGGGGAGDEDSGSSNSSGLIPYWLAFRASTGTEFNDEPFSSLVSPLCVEGKDFWNGTLSVSAYYPGGESAVYAITPTIGDGFYADIPLDPDGGETLIALDNRDDRAFVTAWAPLNVFEGEFTEEPLRLRFGDSLRLAGTNGVNTHFNITRHYNSNWHTVTNFTADAPVPFRFDAAAGMFRIVADSVSTTLVEVVSSKFPISKPAAVVGQTRTLGCPGLSTNAFFECDADLTASVQGVSEGGAILSMLANVDRELGLVSRLGEDGPVLDAAQVVPIWRDVGTYYRVLESYPDGSQMTEVVLRLGALPPGLTVTLEIFVAGVYFEDGTRYKILTAADFDENGIIRILFLRAAGVTSSVCHSTQIFQNGNSLWGN